jgi:hypothetical protein
LIKEEIEKKRKEEEEKYKAQLKALFPNKKIEDDNWSESVLKI